MVKTLHDRPIRQHCLVPAVADDLDVATVAREVVQASDLTSAHGRRLTAQTSVEHAVISAAIASTAAGSRMNMAASDS